MSISMMLYDAFPQPFRVQVVYIHIRRSPSDKPFAIGTFYLHLMPANKIQLDSEDGARFTGFLRELVEALHACGREVTQPELIGSPIITSFGRR